MIRHTAGSHLLGQQGNNPVSILFIGLLWAALLAGPDTSFGQTAAEPQANSPAEFDAYLNVLAKTTPEGVISAAEMFEREWPHSELRGETYEMEMDAFRSLNDLPKTIQAGTNALRVGPHNPAVLATLAYILADSFPDPQHLAQAEHYARKELEVSEKARIPRWIPPHKWDQTHAAMDSEAHAALGLVAYKQGNARGAIQEFEITVKIDPSPDAVQYYRLGLLYQAVENKVKAIQELRLAANSRDIAIRQLAERELNILQH